MRGSGWSPRTRRCQRPCSQCACASPPPPPSSVGVARLYLTARRKSRTEPSPGFSAPQIRDRADQGVGESGAGNRAAVDRTIVLHAAAWRAPDPGGKLGRAQPVLHRHSSAPRGPNMSAREKGVPTKDSVSLLPCFYFVELPILVSSVVSLYFLEWTDVFKPVKSGFTCHDRSLSLPYIDPTHEVIPLLMLLSLAFAGPAITIMIGEAILFCCMSRRRSGGAEANINAAGCNFNSFIRRAVRFVGVHAFGLCATALITDVLQLMTGYPRRTS
ncbi:hypothetical protein INR49_006987 [Caranx melampygus]|nr:hypothetical protein INR49_006987 [Caranx melampygus]